MTATVITELFFKFMIDKCSKKTTDILVNMKTALEFQLILKCQNEECKKGFDDAYIAR